MRNKERPGQLLLPPAFLVEKTGEKYASHLDAESIKEKIYFKYRPKIQFVKYIANSPTEISPLTAFLNISFASFFHTENSCFVMMP